MFASYLKTAFRNVIRQKLYSFINVFGLAAGITACVLIIMYVRYEQSYDQQYPAWDRTYRVTLDVSLGGNDLVAAVASSPLAPTLARDFPAVEAATRIRAGIGYPVVRYGDVAFSEESWHPVDSTFFDVFPVPFIQGDPATALHQPLQVVLTESMARKYFGNENPLGKILNTDHNRDWEVTGVIPDWPHNSHFHYDFLVSLSSYPFAINDNWVSNNERVYVVLREGYVQSDLEDKFPDLILQYAAPQIEQFLQVSWEQLQEGGARYAYHLQPMGDIHLKSHLDNEIEPNGNATYMAVFTLVAIFILLLAVINFMNLSTARSQQRAKEVGIRKTLGSHRGQLITQFLTESVMLTLISVALAFLAVWLLMPWFNNLVDVRLTFDTGIFPVAILGSIVVGLLAGSYPALYLSSFEPAAILRGTAHSRRHGAALRSGLVIFQFTVSIILFSATLVVKNQLDYMQNKNLGLNPDQLIIIEKTDDIAAQLDAFMETLQSYPEIRSVSNLTAVPGEATMNNSVFGYAADDGESQQLLNFFSTDHDFESTFETAMQAGRFFSEDFASDSMGVVLNEAAVAAFGIAEPIGNRIISYNGPDNPSIPIIGVVRDFHYRSLHQKIAPLAIFLFSPRGNSFGRNVAVRVSTFNLTETLAFMEETWKEFAVDQAFEYNFFDESFAALYASERVTNQVITVFSVLAILIACLGLLGLASYTTEQRTKEIGIRKVLGATVASIFNLLTRDVVKLVFIAIIISLPVSFFAMRGWLENFAYRVGYSPGAFLLAGVVSFAIAIGTVTYQALKAASANPVDALRYE